LGSFFPKLGKKKDVQSVKQLYQGGEIEKGVRRRCFVIDQYLANLICVRGKCG